jgi:hypothetical protein
VTWDAQDCEESQEAYRIAARLEEKVRTSEVWKVLEKKETVNMRGSLGFWVLLTVDIL